MSFRAQNVWTERMIFMVDVIFLIVICQLVNASSAFLIWIAPKAITPTPAHPYFVVQNMQRGTELTLQVLPILLHRRT